MNIIDIVLLAFAIWAIYDGFRDGLVVQAGGIVSLLVGIWLAFRYAGHVGQWFGMHGPEASIAGFIAVVVLTVVVVAVVSRLLRGVFRLTGLGVFDSLFGACLSLLKAAIAASLLICAVDAVNVDYRIIGRERIEASRAYVPLRNLSARLFPLFDRIKEQVAELSTENDR